VQLTEYSVLTDEELVTLVITKSNASSLEFEMAQRMCLMIDLLEEHGLYAREPRQGGVQEAA
jgi:hypothetical protein